MKSFAQFLSEKAGESFLFSVHLNNVDEKKVAQEISKWAKSHLDLAGTLKVVKIDKSGSKVLEIPVQNLDRKPSQLAQFIEDKWDGVDVEWSKT